MRTVAGASCRVVGYRFVTDDIAKASTVRLVFCTEKIAVFFRRHRILILMNTELKGDRKEHGVEGKMSSKKKSV